MHVWRGIYMRRAWYQLMTKLRKCRKKKIYKTRALRGKIRSVAATTCVNQYHGGGGRFRQRHRQPFRFRTRRTSPHRAGGGGRDRAEPLDQLCGASRRPPFSFLATGPKKRGPPHRATASLTPTIYTLATWLFLRRPRQTKASVYRVPRIYHDRIIPGRRRWPRLTSDQCARITKTTVVLVFIFRFAPFTVVGGASVVFWLRRFPFENSVSTCTPVYLP